MKIRFVLIVLLLALQVVNSKAQPKQHFIMLNTDINTSRISDFNASNYGMGYEYRPFHFLGFGLSGLYGTFRHNDYRLDNFMDDIQSSYMLYDGNYYGAKFSNRGYLYFNEKRKLAVVGEYYLGAYSINSDAIGMYKEKELTGYYNSTFQFYHGLAVGMQLNITSKLLALVSIGENSIDFNSVSDNTEFNNDPELSIPYSGIEHLVWHFELIISL